MERMTRSRRPTTPAAPPEPRQRRAFATYAGPVETAGAPEEAATLGALFRVDPRLARALTHGFHSYAGRMHPSIARGAINHFSAAGQRVLDPFCGSGTVLVEAMAAGRASVGIDASPLATRLAQVRSTTLGALGRTRLVEEARAIAEEAGERARKRQRPEIPEWARAEGRRFHPHVSLELLGLRELVMETPEDEVGWALRLCLSSLLVKFMRSGPEAPRDGETKRIGRGVPSRFFGDRAEELARGLEALEESAPARTPAPVVRLGDARGYPEEKARSFDLVVTSPPYAGTYDYAGLHEVRFRWLDLPQRRFRERQIGEREEGPGARARAWAAARLAWMKEVARVTRPGASVVLVVGDGVVGHRPEDAAAAVTAAGEEVGLAFVARASQSRPALDRRVREIFGPVPRREHIVLLRRT
jgi:16S rRNA G966 N2-methylase RsmD